MGGRTAPTECEHGKVIDWGDFGADPTDGQVGAEECADCDRPTSGARPAVGDAAAVAVQVVAEALLEQRRNGTFVASEADYCDALARAALRALATDQRVQNALANILVDHQRFESGRCLCKWGEWGRSHADHVTDAVLAALDPEGDDRG